MQKINQGNMPIGVKLQDSINIDSSEDIKELGDQISKYHNIGKS